MSNNFLENLFRQGQESLKKEKEIADRVMNELGPSHSSFSDEENYEYLVWKIQNGFCIVPKGNNYRMYKNIRIISNVQFNALVEANKHGDLDR